MSFHVRMEAQRLADRVEHGDQYAPAQVAVGLAIVLNLLLADRVSIGPRWLVPAVGAVLLAVLIYVTPARAAEHLARTRRYALAVIGLVTLANAISLALLVHYLINGGKANGHELILSGAVLWATNVLLFAVWYWELDSGGPVARFQHPDHLPEFEFPQHDNPQVAPEHWRPGFFDYLYVSLTNATAFSPTDTMPLTQTAKLVMGLQSVTALVTVGLVVARAVNILG